MGELLNSNNLNYENLNNCKTSSLCSYHKELSIVDKEIDIVKNAILQQPNEENLTQYVELINKKRKLTKLVEVTEHNSFSLAIQDIDTVLSNEIKYLLTKKIDKIPIEKINWTEYVKAAITFTSSQSYGGKIEGVYRRKNKYTKVPASEARGDALTLDNKYIEIKFSVMSYPFYQIDIVQIRPHHNIDAYHIIAFDATTNETIFYVLPKAEMTQELQLTGYQLAHGTTNSKNSISNPEYSIRFKKDSDIYERWEKYRKPAIWI